MVEDAQIPAHRCDMEVERSWPAARAEWALRVRKHSSVGAVEPVDKEKTMLETNSGGRDRYSVFG